MSSVTRIPKIIHFIWLTPKDHVKHFNILHKYAVKSAHHYNPDYTIMFHCNIEPIGNEHYEAIKHLVQVNMVETPEEVFGIPIKYMVMKSDVLRLQLLMQYGGVYQDLDIITMRSYDDYLSNDMVLGYELSPKLNPRQIFYFLRTGKWDVIKYKGRVYAGLCAGFMMAAKESIFIRDWYEEYRNFHNDDWAYFPVKLPLLMLKSGKYKVCTINPYQAHFPPCSPEDLKLIFEKNLQIKDKLFLHVWESRSFDKYIAPLTDDEIKSKNTTFTNAVKQFV